jgi:hypothetical protein
VVEQQHDQALHRDESFVTVGACKLAACLGGEQAALSVVDHRPGLRRVGSVTDAWHELPGAHQHASEAFDPLAGDLAPRVRRELERAELDALDAALDRGLGDGGDVEQCGTGQQCRVGCLHSTVRPTKRRETAPVWVRRAADSRARGQRPHITDRR